MGTLLNDNAAKATVLRAMARTTLRSAPASWVAGIKQALAHPNAAVRLAAARACNALPGMAAAARPLAEDLRQPDDVRLAALRSQRSLSTNAVHFLQRQLTNAASPLNRFAAAEILRAHKLLVETKDSQPDAVQNLAEWEPLLKTGNAEPGRAVFFSPKTACGTCHAIAGEGSTIGPDLTKVGAIRSARDILESILFPSSTFAQGYQPFVITTADGQELQGIVARETADGISLRDASGAETPIRKEQIREMKPGTVSLMPSGLAQAMSREEFADLLAYLQSLR
jgi:putative heme-binding domain-containing protein